MYVSCKVKPIQVKYYAHFVHSKKRKKATPLKDQTFSFQALGKKLFLIFEKKNGENAGERRGILMFESGLHHALPAGDTQRFWAISFDK